MAFWSVNSAFQTSETRLKKSSNFLLGQDFWAGPLPYCCLTHQTSRPVLFLNFFLKKPKTTECSTPRNKTDDPLPEFVSTLVDRDQADPGLLK
jgi:hypothetical protein